MKKTTRNIVITLIVALLLGGAGAALLLTDPGRAAPAEESSAPAPNTSLIARDMAEVESVEVKNPQGQFTLLVSEKAAEGEGAEGSAPAEKSYAYTMEGYEDYTLKESTFDTAVKGLCALSSVKDLGPAEDLSAYGLTGGEESAVTLNLKDGSKEEIAVGLDAGETAGRYVLYEGQVYIASVNTAFLTPALENFAPFAYTIEDISDDSGMQPYSIIEKLELTGSSFPEPIKIVYDQEKAEFRMSSPLNTDCSSSAMDAITQALKDFSSDSLVAAKATAEQLAEYGLDAPFAKAEFTINGESHSIAVSEKKTDGARYMLADGDNGTVYTVKADTVAVWAETEAFKLRNSYVFLPMIMNVDAFTVEAEGQSCTVDLSRSKNEEKSTEEQVVYDYTAKKDGKEVAYEDVTAFYKSLISISALNTEKLDYEESPRLKITFKYYEGGQDVLEYRQAGDDRLVALLGGEYSATVRGTSIDEFIAALEDFRTK